MIVLIYRTNTDTAFSDACRKEAEARYPDASIRELNPRFFRAASMDKADVVYVRSGLTTVRNAYVNAGVAVITSPAEKPQEKEVFTDKYEKEVIALLSLSVKRLEVELKGIDDKTLIGIAKDREASGKNRRGAINAYKEALEAK